MNNLQHRQEKIQARRKQTPWRDFVMEICSWMPVIFYKYQGQISRFPDTGRQGSVVSRTLYSDVERPTLEYQDDFFVDFATLFQITPKMIVQQWFDNENSDYAECYAAKNCYLSFSVGQQAENILYSTNSHTTIRNIINSFGVVGNCDNIFSSKVVTGSYNIFYSTTIHDSHNIRFSDNLVGCNECLFCSHLEHKSYCIQNTQYSPEEYKIRKGELLSQKEIFESRYNLIQKKPSDNIVCNNSIGNGMIQSNNIENGYFTKGVQYGKNIYIGGGEEGGEYFYDSFDAGNQKDNHLYATHYVGESSSCIYCVSGGANISNVFYSYHMESCSFCLGCVGLKNKSYCILNKQYTKEERYEKVDEIFTQMEKDGQLGEFFPASMNPFYFNDTAAYLIDPSFTKEEVTAKGYLWRDEPIRVDIPEGAKVVKVSDLGHYEGWKDSGSSPEGQSRWIDPEILNCIIQDEQGNVYKIVKMEYDFLMKYGLPLPRKHRLDRMKENFKI